tara:strand:+ start:19 stop:234 length:216 start_codon:yes stop_codon:yes gene_type:complete
MVVIKERNQDLIVRKIINNHQMIESKKSDSIISQIKEQWSEDQKKPYAIKGEYVLFAIACVVAFCLPFWVM